MVEAVVSPAPEVGEPLDAANVDAGPPREHDPVMRGLFPNRNTFTFENGVRITSEFEAGNLWRCQEFAPEAANDVEPAEEEEGENEAEETKIQ